MFGDGPGVVELAVSVHLGLGVMSLSGKLTIGGGEAVVTTARWLPRFIGGGVTVRQLGGVGSQTDYGISRSWHSDNHGGLTDG